MKSLINYINEWRKPLDVEQCVKGTESCRSEDAEKQPWALYCANSRYNTCLCQSLYMRDLSDAYSMRGVLKK